MTSQVTLVHGGIRPATIDSMVSQERVFHIGPAANVVISGLTITGGNATSGTERYRRRDPQRGHAHREPSLIEGNQATFGGGLSTEGSSTATLINSTLSSNEAEEDGGGVSRGDRRHRQPAQHDRLQQHGGRRPQRRR